MNINFSGEVFKPLPLLRYGLMRLNIINLYTCTVWIVYLMENLCACADLRIWWYYATYGYQQGVSFYIRIIILLYICISLFIYLILSTGKKKKQGLPIVRNVVILSRWTCRGGRRSPSPSRTWRVSIYITNDPRGRAPNPVFAASNGLNPGC